MKGPPRGLRESTGMLRYQGLVKAESWTPLGSGEAEGIEFREPSETGQQGYS